MAAEIRAIACNYLVSTRIVSKGAKAFVVRSNGGNGHDRIVVLCRSRGGRWVEKYEDSRFLGNFRAVTVVAAKSYYGTLQRGYPFDLLGQEFIDLMNGRLFFDATRPLGPDTRARP